MENFFKSKSKENYPRELSETQITKETKDQDDLFRIINERLPTELKEMILSEYETKYRILNKPKRDLAIKEIYDYYYRDEFSADPTFEFIFLWSLSSREDCIRFAKLSELLDISKSFYHSFKERSELTKFLQKFIICKVKELDFISAKLTERILLRIYKYIILQKHYLINQEKRLKNEIRINVHFSRINKTKKDIEINNKFLPKIIEIIRAENGCIEENREEIEFYITHRDQTKKFLMISLRSSLDQFSMAFRIDQETSEDINYKKPQTFEEIESLKISEIAQWLDF